MTDAPSTNLPASPPWCSTLAGHPYTDEAADGKPGTTPVSTLVMYRVRCPTLRVEGGKGGNESTVSAVDPTT